MTTADLIPWLAELYLIVGILLVLALALVPQTHKAIREYWINGPGAGATALAIFGAILVVLARCTG